MRMPVFKKIVCLLILALAVSFADKDCSAEESAAVQGAPSAEAMLKDISGAWVIDPDAWIKVSDTAKTEMNGLGRKEFAALYGRIGFDLDAQTRTIVFHDPQSSLNSSRSFDVLSQNDAGAEDGGVTEVRLKIIDDPGPDMILRYGEGGRVVMFAGEQLVAVFARRK